MQIGIEIGNVAFDHFADIKNYLAEQQLCTNNTVQWDGTAHSITAVLPEELSYYDMNEVCRRLGYLAEKYPVAVSMGLIARQPTGETTDGRQNAC